MTEEENPENQKEVYCLQIKGPFSGLEENVELVDTPGVGSIHQYHDELLHDFIPRADAIIFMVTARMPLDQDELELLAKVKEADISKVFFVLNRIDEATSEDIESATKHNLALLAQHGVEVNRLYPISAKQAFNGNLSESGVPVLTDGLLTVVPRVS